MKCGDIAHAESLFHELSDKTLNTYGAMMSGFNQQNNPAKTLNLFNQLKTNGLKADIIIYLCVIKALSQIGHYEISQLIVKQIPDFLLAENQDSECIDRFMGN